MPLKRSWKTVCFGLVFGSLWSCTSLVQNSSQSSESESELKFGQYASEKMRPNANLVESDDNKNPVYNRTQADLNYSMAEAYSNEGLHQKAIEYFKLTRIYDPESPIVLQRLTQEYIKSGLFTEALSVGLELLKIDGKSEPSLMLVAGIYSTMRIYPKAIELYEAVLKNKPNHVEAPLYLGAIFSETKQYEKAIKYFQNLTQNPEYSYPYLAYYYMGRVSLEQKDSKHIAEAEKYFLKSNLIKPDFPEAILSLGSLYLQKDQDEKAFEVYENFQKKYGPNLKIAEILGQMYIEHEKYDEAYEQLELIENRSDSSLQIKMKLALILIEKKMYDRAIVKLEDILKEAPDSDKVRFYLGAIYEELKQTDRAVYHYGKIISESQYYIEACLHSSYLLRGNGKIKEALEIMEKALNAKKDNPQVLAMYASLLDESGAYQEALKLLEAGIAKFPQNAQIRFFYGTLHDKLGDKTKVIKELQTVLEIDPNHVQALNYLAYTWAEIGSDLDQAEKLIRKAVELDPKDGYILDTLGWVLYKKGQLDKSIGYLEVAHKYQPTVGIIAEHLGDVYLKLSLTQKAEQMYNKAIELETDQNKISVIRAKLTSIRDQKSIQERSPASAQKEK